MKRFSSFQDLIDTQTETCGDRPAFLIAENKDKHVITWNQFHHHVYERADQLKQEGHTCIGILSDGSLSSITEIFAASIAGMQIVMLDHMLPTALLAQLIAYTDIDTLYGSALRKKELEPFLTKGIHEKSNAVLFFTSGTTSRSKAVELSDESLMASAWNGGMMLPLKEEDILLNVLPLAHVFGFVCGLLWPMSCGAVTALGRGMRHYGDDPSFFKPTAMSLVPLLLDFYLKHHLLNPELGLILVGAGSCDPALLEEVKNRNIRISYGYGLTETSSGVAISTHGDPSGMEVCPDDTITLAQDGEILIQAPACMMRGYYKKPEDTEEILKGGVLHTGDLGRFDAEGRLHITGRKKDILVLPNGTKIFLPEYEMAIMKALNHPDIAVVLKNHRPVLVTGKIESSKEEIRLKLEDIMKNLPHGQQITEIIQLDHKLARTAAGKLQRWQIQKEIEK